jgi:flagellar hook-associated protein 2
MRSIETQISSILNTGLKGLGNFSYVAELGITTKEGGGMKLASADLTAAMQDDPESVIQFFSDENSGFAAKMDGMLDSFLQSGGVIDSIVDGAKSEVTRIARNRSLLEQRLISTEARIRSQFEALDTLMSSMQTTSNYLTSQLDSLSNLLSGGRK